MRLYMYVVWPVFTCTTSSLAKGVRSTLLPENPWLANMPVQMIVTIQKPDMSDL